MIVSLLLTAMLAVSSDSPASPTAGQPPKEKKICRTEVATGSIMPKRVCRTAAEWAAIEHEQEDVTRDEYQPNRNGR